MTTIVADIRVGLIGADTFCNRGYRASKLFRVKGRGVFGCAGDDTAIARFEHWLIRKQKRPEQITAPEEFEALQIVGGKLYVWGAALRAEPLLDPFDSSRPAQFYAVGSGGQLAMGCLAQGGTLREALRVAELFDDGTKGPFTYLDTK